MLGPSKFGKSATTGGELLEILEPALEPGLEPALEPGCVVLVLELDRELVKDIWPAATNLLGTEL